MLALGGALGLVPLRVLQQLHDGVHVPTAKCLVAAPDQLSIALLHEKSFRFAMGPGSSVVMAGASIHVNWRDKFFGGFYGDSPGQTDGSQLRRRTYVERGLPSASAVEALARKHTRMSPRVGLLTSRA